MMRLARCRAAALAGIVGIAACAKPLTEHTASAPAGDAVTVGDRFQLRLVLRGAWGRMPELRIIPADTAALELARAPSWTRRRDMAIVELEFVAWRAGARPRAVARVSYAGERSGAPPRIVPLRLPFVRSVLPADTAGLAPKPAKDVVDLPLAATLRWLALLGLAVLALAGLLRTVKRRRSRGADPGRAALARLASLRDIPEPDRTVAAAEVLRGFLSTIRADWSRDLTTTELLERLGAEPGPARDAVARLLAAADQAKFAGPARRIGPFSADDEAFAAVEDYVRHAANSATEPGAIR